MSSPDVLVVRGGTLRDVDELLEKALDAAYRRADGCAVLSVFASPPLAGENQRQQLNRICAEAPVRHGQIQVSSMQRLADAGLAIVKDDSDGQGELHYHVTFGTSVRRSDIEAFVGAFDAPVPRPRGGSI